MMLANLGTPTTRRRNGRPPTQKYDCGKYGRLSISQICTIAGIGKTAASKRIAAGYRGEKLCAPRGLRDFARKGEPHRPTMIAAARIARQFAGRAPTWREIQRAHPMAESTARHWEVVFRKVAA